MTIEAFGLRKSESPPNSPPIIAYIKEKFDTKLSNGYMWMDEITAASMASVRPGEIQRLLKDLDTGAPRARDLHLHHMLAIVASYFNALRGVHKRKFLFERIKRHAECKSLFLWEAKNTLTFSFS